MAVVAIKDIKENDEILVTYGHGYWISRRDY
jgi:SET domain-containing protein